MLPYKATVCLIIQRVTLYMKQARCMFAFPCDETVVISQITVSDRDHTPSRSLRPIPQTHPVKMRFQGDLARADLLSLQRVLLLVAHKPGQIPDPVAVGDVQQDFLDLQAIQHEKEIVAKAM